MKSRLFIGKIAGIRIEIHWTFLFIIAWAIYIGWNTGGNVSAIVWSTVFILSIFFCVVLHELGHALTARRFGIKTRRITLLPIGGVASLERMPEKPKQELWVAIMGPAVNVIIAFLLYFLVHDQLSVLLASDDPEAISQSIGSDNFLVYLFFTNIALVVFNMIPAFPMDGGRVLRALLSFKMDRVRATQIAASLGQIIAVIFLFLGFAYNPILIFISLFVYLGASGEYTMVRQLGILKGHRVEEAMMTNFTLFRPEDDLGVVGKVLLSGTERQFVVVDDNSRIVGILSKEGITQAFQSPDKNLTVGDVMVKEFQTVHLNADLGKIYRTALGQKHHFFPVVDKQDLIGVIDMENINEFMMIQSKLDY